MSNGNDTGGMDILADETAQEVNALLSDREAELLQRTTLRLEELRPRFETEQEDFDQLIQAVSIATSRNESVAQFKQRLMALGEGVVRLAARVASFIPV